MLTNTHLNPHGINLVDYKKRFPGAETASQELRDRYSERSKKTNAGRKGVARTAEELANINAGIAAAPTRIPHNKGIPATDEEKELTSRLAKERNEVWRQNDNHPLKGRKLSQETKDKISASVKEQINANQNK